jgi:hypothetical protein
MQQAKRAVWGKPDSDVGPVISPEKEPVGPRTGVHEWGPEIGRIKKKKNKNKTGGESERNGGASGQRKVQVSLERKSGSVQNAARDEGKKQLREKTRTESSDRWVPWIGQCRWPEEGTVRIQLLSSRTLITGILRRLLPTFHPRFPQLAEAETSFTLQVVWLELNLRRLLDDIMDVS